MNRKAAKPVVPDVTPIEWHRFGPKVQSHGLCRYCDGRGVAMRKLASGWVLVCQQHRREAPATNQ